MKKGPYEIKNDIENEIKNVLLEHVKRNYYIYLPSLGDEGKIWGIIKETSGRTRYPGEEVEAEVLVRNQERMGWRIEITRNGYIQESFVVSLSETELNEARRSYPR